ncbi:hypothetical protein NFI96_025733 [Prochilodus magdalenae]|nr:hypothetical protein NFI96_025733 [Prochilodus magdalenae]
MSARGEEGGGGDSGEASGSQEQPGPAEPPKRGPGRPRKPQQEPTGEPVPKRPRGRPKGSKNKGPSKAAQKILLFKLNEVDLLSHAKLSKHCSLPKVQVYSNSPGEFGKENFLICHSLICKLDRGCRRKENNLHFCNIN